MFGGICNAAVLYNRISNSTMMKSGNTIAAQPIYLPLNPYICHSTHIFATQPIQLPPHPVFYAELLITENFFVSLLPDCAPSFLLKTENGRMQYAPTKLKTEN